MVRASTLSPAFLALEHFPGLSGALRNIVAMTRLPVSRQDGDAAAADFPASRFPVGVPGYPAVNLK
jgi:hypothetical protein